MNVSRITHHASRITLAAALALVLLSIATSTPAQIPFSLDAANWPDPKAISLAIPESGLITLQLIRTNSGAWTNALEFKLLSFRDVATGELLPVKMYIPGQGSRSNAVEEFDFQFQPGQTLLELALTVTPPISTNTYLGSLGLRENSGLWSLQKLALHRPAPQKPATLVVDQPALNVSITGPLFGSRNTSTPDVTLTIHDETRTWPVEGISVSPRAISSPARNNLILDKNVVFFLNGIALTNLTQSPTNPVELAQRSLAAARQGALGLGFIGLAAGDYSLELKLLAFNSKDDDKQQRVTINVKVSNSVGRAAATLICALLLSFVTYKGLRIYQQWLGFQRRLAALRGSWLDALPPYYSVVWARTVLDQTENMIHKLLLVDPALITERFEKVSPVLDALKEAHRARAALRDLPQLVANRFEAVVFGHVRSMSDQDMCKEAVQKAKDALSTLNADLAAKRINDPYWSEVQKEVSSFFLELSDKQIDSFRSSLDTTSMTQAGKADVDAILSTRKALPPYSDLREMMDYERKYMKAKLLFERREHKEFPDLIEVFENDLDKSFDVVDEADWNDIKQKVKLRVVAPINDGRSCHEEYEPLQFSVTTDNKELDGSYLFHYGLKFKWHVSLGEHPDPHDDHDGAPNGGPETLSPRIVYFSTQPGTLWVSAKAFRTTRLGEDQKSCSEPVPLRLGRSSEFKTFQHLEWAEVVFLVLAALFALISGLLTFYYKNPTFGSFQDYLMLFLWGVGVDQTKNFLQVMQSQKPDSTS